ncbi:hypothetical protein [Streptomyces sp. NPDC051218]|uniref:MmyB family transcriptional regulator n=1 Tax=Streptomyces sp. NPDC051218 TaxID=3365645 RepID=UPI0037AD5B27
MKSPEFAALWAGHQVHPCDFARYEMLHPLVGTLTVTQQSLHLPQAEGQHLVLAVTEPGSPSREAVTLLQQATTTDGRDRPEADHLEADHPEAGRPSRALGREVLL